MFFCSVYIAKIELLIYAELVSEIAVAQQTGTGDQTVGPQPHTGYAKSPKHAQKLYL